jgi:transcriptional regulator with XRE-family HTH domain
MEENMNIRIANRLLEYRRASGYSQEELAAKIGVSRQAVSKWERVEASPDTDNLIALASLYGVTIDELINGSKNPTEKAGAAGSADDKNSAGAAVNKETKDSAGDAGKDTGKNAADDGDEDGGEEKDDDDDNEDDDCGDGTCCGDKKTDRVSIGLSGIHVSDKNGDEVHISLKGIHIEDKNGEKVHIEPGNIHVHNEDGDTVVETKDGKVYVNDEECHHAPHWFSGILPMLTIIAYLVMGFTIPDGYGWTRGWLVFFLIPILLTLVTAVRKRKPSYFAYPVLVAGIYLFVGMVYGFWHPHWIIFLTIPIYYIISGAIEHARKIRIRCCRGE